jgi:hypothetical protein
MSQEHESGAKRIIKLGDAKLRNGMDARVTYEQDERFYGHIYLGEEQLPYSWEFAGSCLGPCMIGGLNRHLYGILTANPYDLMPNIEVIK